MSQLQRFTVLTELADQLREAGSWVGETNLQKAAYFLQELFRIDSNFEFILYRHGPFSFDLREDLSILRATGFVEFVPYPPYGPRILPTAASHDLRKRFPKTLARIEKGIAFVARHLGRKDVVQLERLATALYVIKNSPAKSDVRQLAARVHQVKPHVTVEDATVALKEVEQLITLATKA